MATLYTKTALKKIKKDELVEMFLDQQAKHNNLYLAFERSSNSAMESLGEQEVMLKENQKLKEKLISKSEELTNIRREKSELEDIIFEHMKKGTIKYEQKFL